MGTFLILLLFFVLEALATLLWVCGTIGAAAITCILLHGTAESALDYVWWYCGVWGVLFAIPGILQMLQSAVWCRGLTQWKSPVVKKRPYHVLTLPGTPGLEEPRSLERMLRKTIPELIMIGLEHSNVGANRNREWFRVAGLHRRNPGLLDQLFYADIGDFLFCPWNARRLRSTIGSTPMLPSSATRSG